MSSQNSQSRWFAGVALVLLIGTLASPVYAQSGKPEYKPEVEAVARTIFLELMSPW